ncbi:MAG: hypothetical protein P9F75_03985 [Candidatus Contendobacter sp.]|nr:hypothetical protein [Candidatus Contendobacter sp.]
MPVAAIRENSAVPTDDSPGLGVTAIRLASGIYRFDDLSEAQAITLRQRYSQFFSISLPPGDLALAVEMRELTHPLSTNPEAFTVAGEYTPMLERTPDQLTVTGINFQATLQWGEPMRATLAVARGPDSALINAIENFLRVVSAYRVLSKGGLLLHSAGLVVDEQAYLFAGQSGAGKTTLTGKAHQAGAGILSDDINIALPGEDGRFRAYPVPFAGDFGQTPDRLAPGGYPLAALCVLEQGGAVTLEPLSNAAATARLVAASPFVNADPHKSSDLLEAAAHLVRLVPVRKLISRREDDFNRIHGLLRELTDDR